MKAVKAKKERRYKTKVECVARDLAELYSFAG